MNDLAKAVIGRQVSDTQVIVRKFDLEKLLEAPLDPHPEIIICGPPPNGIPALEAAQCLRMLYSESVILYVTTVRAGFERRAFINNGFNDAFLLPLDDLTFESRLKDELGRATLGALKSYRTVKLIDITPGEELDFDTFIFLPANRKYIKYSAAGDPLDQERAVALARQINAIHVTQDQIQKVYDFTARQIKKMGKDPSLSETEKGEKVQAAIREILSELFNDSAKDATIEKGRAIIADCQGIVKSYITEGKPGSWYEKLLQVSDGTEGAYSHAANVASFAALFSMSLGIGVPEQLAMAGLLHDIGLADVSQWVQSKEPALWNIDEKRDYERHPDHTINMIKTRKMLVPEIVLKMIHQHHEKYCGSGYPKGFQGSRILREAQLLAIADYFDELLAIVPGRPSRSPLQAMKEIKTQSENPTTARFDIELVDRLIAAFDLDLS